MVLPLILNLTVQEEEAVPVRKLQEILLVLVLREQVAISILNTAAQTEVVELQVR